MMSQSAKRERSDAHAFFIASPGVAGSVQAPVLPQGDRETGGAFFSCQPLPDPLVLPPRSL